jgi:glycosyltransferase involved in cell wall biosynthesis
MKILFIHNYYGSAAPSGENVVFEAEKAMLEKNGHEVYVHCRYSDQLISKGLWGKILAATSIPYNFIEAQRIKTVVEKFQPDVVHAHNTFPSISPAFFRSIGTRAAKVLTLHNYRLLCPAAIPLRNGIVCTECIDSRSSFKAINYGCYRGSSLSTFPLVFNVELHRFLNTWNDTVDAFIALTDFQKNKFIDGGLPENLLFVKPNFFPGMPSVKKWIERKPVVIFVGRLSAEKGVKTLIDAWRIWGANAPELRIIGEGPLRNELELMAYGLPVSFKGQVSSIEAVNEIAQAKLLVLPSEWFEGFPMVIREAFAHGTPVAVSDIGPLASIVTHNVTGIVFSPGNPKSIYQSISELWQQQEKLHIFSEAAHNEFMTKYTEASNYKKLMQIYNGAIKKNALRIK